LEEGDIADIHADALLIVDKDGQQVEREVHESDLNADATGKNGYRHYMLKEIHEQPSCLLDVFEGRVHDDKLSDATFGLGALEVFDKIKCVQIIACGTSYHAGLIAKYWLEDLVGIPCRVEVASEFRYRNPVLMPDSLIVTISQSGETADTLAALRSVKDRVKSTLAICNVPESSLVRECELSLMTRAGPEIGVASTKAFTSQLLALMMLVVALGKQRGMQEAQAVALMHEALALPAMIEKILSDSSSIEKWAEKFTDLSNTIFLGRGVLFPIALEGALKLKEISYIHADAYPAGELKHGPIALIEPGKPVIAVACKDGYEDKIKSNLQEVLTRGGEVYVFADEYLDMSDMGEHCHVITLPSVSSVLAPLLYAIPLQLLSYFVAVQKGTDVDQPRNLAKSVTVE
ncbi:MAG: glutamine--fructose-6-phosphate transaminase (isomerizing), partial [Gammaproteobacteria bacterium]|nr:glutamine--fructose-6-phosphate transaminase (isomerizing) [Gammaproteobacteria bacterium]